MYMYERGNRQLQVKAQTATRGLTVSHIRSIRQLRIDDVSFVEKFQWAIGIPQLFHIRMAAADMILKIHLHTANTPGSLAEHATTLDRKRVNTEFQASEELIIESLHARVIAAWEAHLKTDALSDIPMEHFLEKCANFVTEFVLRKPHRRINVVPKFSAFHAGCPCVS